MFYFIKGVKDWDFEYSNVCISSQMHYFNTSLLSLYKFSTFVFFLNSRLLLRSVVRLDWCKSPKM